MPLATNPFFLEYLMTCRHCLKAPVTRPRGLCWGCFYTPKVRRRYRSTSKFARRGYGNFYSDRPLPTCTTAAPPGSAEKIAVLAERARRKQSLWHPCDAHADAASNRAVYV